MSPQTDRIDEPRLNSLDLVLDARNPHPGLAEELFMAADLFGSDPALRRAVTDPGAPVEARQQLVSRLLGGRVSEEALTVLREAAGLRWRTAGTFVSAVERQAIRAALAQAQVAGQLDQVEDELFHVNRTVAGSPELRDALSDDRRPLVARQDMAAGLLAGKATPVTITLVRRGVAAHQRTFANTVDGYVALAAAQRNRAVATVRVARPLTGVQSDRLHAALTKQLGRPVTMHVIEDPTVLGGVSVEVGDEVIDGTVASRLDEARKLFS
ncbi:ATP synthase F1 subcomplex delta subunit [Raineyella antarctica]|uniref:ATP synthase subunit delta n=1 Tax=Raineyella antarctica TaxID=1577474 RepID=A0A1G6GUG2_9ACTN|nr:F0F1 ATP synthase subunit delta [Raineyella antarctica]SDB85598.1 ATP synthase F1 subcomplex delta subunit [Raineyella antarctica]